MRKTRQHARVAIVTFTMLTVVLIILVGPKSDFSFWERALAQSPIRFIVENFVVPLPCTDRVPHESYCFLGRKGLGDDLSATEYYTNIGALTSGPHGSIVKDTLAAFKQRNGFPVNEIRTVYFNNGDLQLGRDMHCRQGTEVSPGNFRIACYVSNYGPEPFIAGTGKAEPGFPDPATALEEAIAQSPHPFATVAMEYSPNPESVTVSVSEGFGITANPNPPRSCPFVGYIIPPALPNQDVDTGIDIEAGDAISFTFYRKHLDWLLPLRQ